MIKEIVVASFAFMMMACGSTQSPQAPQQAQSSAAPSWYIQPPASDANTLYGVGEGVNKEDAIAHALSNIVARLNVSISSSFSSKSVVREGRTTSIDREYVDNVKSEVQAIRVSNYETLSYKKLGFKRYAALVKVDRASFARSLQKEIERDLYIEQNSSDLSGVELLRSLEIYKEKLQKLQDLEYKIAVLSTLDSSVDEKRYLKEYTALKQRYEALRQSITFWVTSSYGSLVKPIQDGLAKEHFLIKRVKNSKHFDVVVEAEITQAKAYGFTIARANVTVVTKDSSGAVVGSNSFSLIGRSAQGFAVAKQELSKELSKKIEAEGIFKVLGLDI
jgi:hypothetical protein